MAPVEISAGRLHLRPWSRYDEAALRELFADPETAAWTPAPMPFTEEEARRRIAEAYPTTKEPPTQPYQVPWTAHNYHGPLRMYLSSGFYVHRQMDGWVIVRKRLEPIEEPRHDAEDGM